MQPKDQNQAPQPSTVPGEPYKPPAQQPVTQPSPTPQPPQYPQEPAQQMYAQPPVQQPIPPVIQAPMQPQGLPGQLPTEGEGEKSYVAAVVLSYLVGNLGVDRFYLGYTVSGIIKLITFGGLGIWQLIDFIRIVFGKMAVKGDNRKLQGYAEHNKLFKVLFLVLLALQVLIIGGILAALALTTFTGVQGKARDTERQTDIKYLHGQVESYYVTTGTYPTLAQFNEAIGVDGIDPEGFKDPQGTTGALVEKPSRNAYSYQAGPSNCDGIQTKCSTYTLTATLEDGGIYTKKNKN